VLSKKLSNNQQEFFFVAWQIALTAKPYKEFVVQFCVTFSERLTSWAKAGNEQI